jgi:hypothetical protein
MSNIGPNAVGKECLGHREQLFADGGWCCCTLTQHVLSDAHNLELRLHHRLGGLWRMWAGMGFETGNACFKMLAAS